MFALLERSRQVPRVARRTQSQAKFGTDSAARIVLVPEEKYGFYLKSFTFNAYSIHLVTKLELHYDPFMNRIAFRRF